MMGTKGVTKRMEVLKYMIYRRIDTFKCFKMYEIYENSNQENTSAVDQNCRFKYLLDVTIKNCYYISFYYIIYFHKYM